jgi:hypothetical protein
MQQALKEIENGDEVTGRSNMAIAERLISQGRGEILVGEAEVQIGEQEMIRGQAEMNLGRTLW